MNQVEWSKHRDLESLGAFKGIFNLETKYLVFLTDIWSFQLIVDAGSSRIEIGKVAESLREDTFLEKSLPVVILGTVGILGSKPMYSFSFSPESNKATFLEETFLEAQEAKILFEKHLTM